MGEKPTYQVVIKAQVTFSTLNLYWRRTGSALSLRVHEISKERNGTHGSIAPKREAWTVTVIL